MRTPLHVLRRTLARARRTAVVGVTVSGVVAASALAYGDGIDVSHWQGAINWTKVDNAGVGFAFMKATEATTYTDTRFATNFAAAKSVGIYRGAYHFAQPGSSSGAAQARYYVSQVGATTFKQAGVLPPVLDLETTGGLGPTALRNWVADWLSTTESLTGRTPILYFSPYFWIDHVGNSTAFARYPLWIAHYTTGSPKIPGGWTRYTFWQYTSSGSVSGIGGNVDKNRFYGTSAQLAALANASGGSSAPPPPGPSVPSTTATALTGTASSATSPINGTVDLTGTLRSAPVAPTASAPLATRTVGLWRRDAGATAWTMVATGTTDSAGQYLVSARVPRTADFQVRWAGNKTYAASTSAVRRVTTPARRPLVVDAHALRTRVRPGTAVMLYGHVTDAGRGSAPRRVNVWKKKPTGGHWVFVGTVTSKAPTGWWSITVHPLRTRVYRAVAVSTLFFEGDRSERARVDVRR